MPLRPHLLAACLAAPALALVGAFGASAQQAESGDLAFGTDVPAAATLSTQGMADRRLIFTLFAGAETRPTYFGSEENEIVPRFSPNVLALNFGAIEIGPEDGAIGVDPYRRPLGFGIGGSFRFVTARNADDHDELQGLDDIDLSVEVGAQVGYIWSNAEVFGQARYGVLGHESWVGEVGANLVARPVEGLALRVGPRFLFGSDQYNDTYFGITPDEAANSDFDAYDPDAGLVSAGVEMIATYRLGDRWWLEGRARWDQFQDDAADSPIVEQGTRDQGTVSIGVRRAFVLDF